MRIVNKMTTNPHDRNPLGDKLNHYMACAAAVGHPGDYNTALEIACRDLPDGALHRLAIAHDTVKGALEAACVEVMANREALRCGRRIP